MTHYRNDFISACIEFADKLRVRQRPEVESLGEKVLDDCSKLKAVRDHICNWVLLESEITDEETFSEILINVLEHLRELKSKPPEITSWNNSWFEAHSVFIYETFLYIVAALLRTNAYKVLHEVYASNYLIPSDRHGQSNFEKFDCFYGYSKTLQAVLAPKGQRLYAPAAELIKIQADREDIPFSDIRQADLLTLMMSFITPDTRWYPGTLHYSSYGNRYPFFIRAAQHKNFLKLATITGINTADELREKVKEGHQRLNTDRWHNLYYDQNFWSSLNMDELDSLK